MMSTARKIEAENQKARDALVDIVFLIDHVPPEALQEAQQQVDKAIEKAQERVTKTRTGKLRNGVV